MANPYLDPAYACELTMRERKALMSRDDWEFMLDRLLSWLSVEPESVN